MSRLTQLALLSIEVEANRRLDTRHFRMDLPSGSSSMDSGPSSTAPKENETLLLAYAKGKSQDDLEDAVVEVFRRVPDRQVFALLVRHLKEDRRNLGIWACTYESVCLHQEMYRKTLGFPAPFLFGSASSIKSCADRGWKSLILVLETQPKLLGLDHHSPDTESASTPATAAAKS